MALIDNIKTELGISGTGQDGLLSLLIENEKDNARNITHNVYASDDDAMIQRMVVWRYNTLGTEGLSSENYSGVSYSYKGDYPDDIMQILRSYKKVRVVGND